MKIKRIISIALSLLMVASIIPLSFSTLAETVEPLAGPVTLTPDGDANAVGTYDEYVFLNRVTEGVESGVNKWALEGYSDTRWDRPSSYTTLGGWDKDNYKSATIRGFATKYDSTSTRWAYIGLKVSVAAAGQYQFTAKLNTGSNKAFNAMVLVDGLLYTANFGSKGSMTKQSTATITLSLEAGTHYIAFSMPTVTDHSVVMANPENTQTDITSWTNYTSIEVPAGVSVHGAPTLQEMMNSVTSAKRLEAEDGAYATLHGAYAGATAETATEEYPVPSGASGKSFIGGVTGAERDAVKNSNLTIAAIREGLNKNSVLPYVQYMVTAPADGKYNLRVGAYIGGSGTALPDAVLIANDTLYTSSWIGGMNNYNNAYYTVNLKKGVNIIKAVGLTADYLIANPTLKPYINMDYIEFDHSLTPVKAEATLKLEAEDTKYIYVDESQGTVKATNNDGNGLQVKDTGHLRWDSVPKSQKITATTVTYEQATSARMPHFKFNVIAENDGYYDISLKTGWKRDYATGHWIAVFVDKAGYARNIYHDGTTKATTVDISTYLTKGIHEFVITTMMPKDVAELESLVPADQFGNTVDGHTHTDTNKAYQILDYDSITFSQGVEFKPKLQKLEAENSVWHLYDNNNETPSGVSGTVVGGASYFGETTATIKNLADTYKHKNAAPYVLYQVDALADGKYFFGIKGYYGMGTTTDNGVKPHLAAIVNGGAPIQLNITNTTAQFNNQNYMEFTADLHKGRNVIIVTAPLRMDSGEPEKWICFNQDYLDIDMRLEGVSADNAYTTHNAVSDKVTYNDRYLTKDGTSLTGGQRGDASWDKVTTSNLTKYNLSRMPYVAVKVTAPEDGYYDITLNAKVPEEVTHRYIAAMVDGVVHTINFSPAAADSTTGIDTSLYLTKGTHNIVFSTALDNKTANYPNDTDITLVSVSAAGLTFEAAPARAELEPTRITLADINGDKKPDAELDTLQREAILKGTAVADAADINSDKSVDICDLVAFDNFRKNDYKVYVSDRGLDTNPGTHPDAPLKTLGAALDRVGDNGTIYIIGTLTPDAHFGWANQGKKVNITGGTLALSAVDLHINDDVTFSNITITGTHPIYANGHHLTMGEKVTISSQTIYGALKLANLYAEYDTHITLLSGSYSHVYGGRQAGELVGDVTVEVGGTANVSNLYGGGGNNTTVMGDVDITINGNATVYAAHGGGNGFTTTEEDGTVTVTPSNLTGNTSLKVSGNAIVNYAYGGGRHSVVYGNTSVIFLENSAAANVFGGGVGLGADVTGTATVTFNAKQVNNVFGGADTDATHSGHTVVNYLGGKVSGWVNNYNKDMSPVGATQNLYKISSAGANPTISTVPTVYMSDKSSNMLLVDGAAKVYSKSALDSSTGTVITVDTSKKLHSIDGFGASITDSAALSMAEMPASELDKAWTMIFDKEKGIGINIIRNCIGASDFAKEYYTYQDSKNGAFDFSHDEALIVPYTKRAMNSINASTGAGGFQLILSPWTAPLWMKTVNQWQAKDLGNGSPRLQTQYYDEYATYLTNAVKAWEKNGVPVSIITPQNEPKAYVGWPGMIWTDTELSNFTVNNLRPTLTSAGLKTKILNFDHNYRYYQNVLNILDKTNSITNGVAWHWYNSDENNPSLPEMMLNVTAKYPGIMMYVTEASSGKSTDTKDLLYIGSIASTTTKIARAIRSGASAFVAWNLALNQDGGPAYNGVNSHCIGLIECNDELDMINYTHTYYGLGHYSKHIDVGARVISSTDTGANSDYDLVNLVVQNPDGSYTAVITNNQSTTVGSTACKLVVGDKVVEVTVPNHSVYTITWKN